MEGVIKIEVKDNNIEQALRVLKRKLQREGFFKILKIKSNYEKPSERKKRESARERAFEKKHEDGVGARDRSLTSGNSPKRLHSV